MEKGGKNRRRSATYGSFTLSYCVYGVCMTLKYMLGWARPGRSRRAQNQSLLAHGPNDRPKITSPPSQGLHFLCPMRILLGLKFEVSTIGLWHTCSWMGVSHKLRPQRRWPLFRGSENRACSATEEMNETSERDGIDDGSSETSLTLNPWRHTRTLETIYIHTIKLANTTTGPTPLFHQRSGQAL